MPLKVLKLNKCFCFLVEVFDYSNTTLSTENHIILKMEPIIEEFETHVSSQGPLSAGVDNSLNTPTDEDTDDNIRDPDYNPSSDESSAPENEDSQAVGAATPEQHGEDIEENNWNTSA